MCACLQGHVLIPRHICCLLKAELFVVQKPVLNYLEAVRVSVYVEMLDGDLGIIAHRLSTVGAG